MIGSYPSNQWGLKDMIGNVYEWCSDWANKLSSEPQINPTGPAEGDFKITRGGSYKTSLTHIGLLYKGFAEPKDAFNDIGFDGNEILESLIKIEKAITKKKRWLFYN